MNINFLLLNSNFLMIHYEKFIKTHKGIEYEIKQLDILDKNVNK